jgi:hypothetical protein
MLNQADDAMVCSKSRYNAVESLMPDIMKSRDDTEKTKSQCRYLLLSERGLTSLAGRNK